MDDTPRWRFDRDDLERIADAGLIYQCACPAQVAGKLLQLRDFFDYQRECAASGDPLGVHSTIIASVVAAHDELERCLDKVLDIEGWDRSTYRMPPGLRSLRMDDGTPY
ncbi:MAG: hypothetical protein ACK4KV_10270 [Rhodocyclaceae bacterium]